MPAEALVSLWTMSDPESVTSSSVVVAVTATSPPASPSVTVEPVIAAATVVSSDTIATMPAKESPDFSLPSSVIHEPPLSVREPPTATVTSFEVSAAETSRPPEEDVSVESTTVAVVACVPPTTATDAPNDRLVPPPEPDGRSVFPVGWKVPINDPDTVQIASSPTALTVTPASFAAALVRAASIVAVVVVVSQLTVTEPANEFVDWFRSAVELLVPLPAAAAITRAFLACTSRAKPPSSARRIDASTAEDATSTDTAPARAVDEATPPASASRSTAAPVRARSVVVFSADTASFLSAAEVVIDPLSLIVATTVSATFATATEPDTPTPKEGSCVCWKASTAQP